MLRFKAALLKSHKVEAGKPEGTAAVKMRSKMTEQDARKQQERRGHNSLKTVMDLKRGDKE